MTGSLGTGKGIRSISTKRHVFPGKSTPCHSERVPIKQAELSSRMSRTRAAMESSPWTMMGKSVRSRSISPARSAILREENSPSAPPPEASTSSTSRSQNTSGCSPRVGAGKSRARYKMPCRSWRNGEPTSRVSGCGSSSCRPILCMSGANVPPSLSVAEVAMMACSLHNRFASFPATSSGAV